jgi:hypothetical protein
VPARDWTFLANWIVNDISLIFAYINKLEFALSAGNSITSLTTVIWCSDDDFPLYSNVMLPHAPLGQQYLNYVKKLKPRFELLWQLGSRSLFLFFSPSRVYKLWTKLTLGGSRFQGTKICNMSESCHWSQFELLYKKILMTSSYPPPPPTTFFCLLEHNFRLQIVNKPNSRGVIFLWNLTLYLVRKLNENEFHWNKHNF